MIESGRMKWAGYITRMGEKRNTYRIWVGKLEGKRPLGRPRRRWVHNIKIYLREIAWNFMDWIDLVQDKDQWRPLFSTIMNLKVPYNIRKFLSSCTIGGFSRRAQLHEVSQFIAQNGLKLEIFYLKNPESVNFDGIEY
jgi:hypothetical protein